MGDIYQKGINKIVFSEYYVGIYIIWTENGVG